MRQISLIILCTFLFSIHFQQTHGQVSVAGATHTTPNLSSSYTSLDNALSALKTITAISGAVTITLDPSNPQTAPAGGYLIDLNGLSNTSSSPITISGSGNTITAYSPQTSGSLTDAIFKIIGADYITIEDFIMQENSSNTTTVFGTNNMTEWGIALLYASTSDGAQHNLISNNTISLNNSYANTFGIYSNVRHSATNATTSAGIINATTAPNSSNNIYGNTISNVNFGIVFIGSDTASYMDTGNDIGGNSSTTGNTITSWGGSGAPSAYVGNLATYTASYYGIYVNCQKNENVSYNIITSSTLTGTAAVVRGIQKSYRTSSSSGTVSPGGTFTSTIENNLVTLTTNLPNNSHVDGIFTENASSGSASLFINDNIIEGMSIQNTSSSNQMRGINNSSSVSVLEISGNLIRGNSSTATTGLFTAINQTGSVITTIDINNNSIGDTTISGDAITYSNTTSAVLRGINNSNTNGTLFVNIKNNSFQGFEQLGSSTTGARYYIDFNHSTTTTSVFEISNNTFINVNANTSGEVYCIRGAGTMTTNAGANVIVSNNSTVGSFTKTASSGNVYFYYTAGNSSTGNFMSATGNNFSNVTTSGTSVITGVTHFEGGTAGPQKNISNNVFENWSSGSPLTFGIFFHRGSGNSIISNNIIKNITSTGSINAILSQSTTADTLNISGNIITGLNTSASGGEIAAIKFTALNAVTNIQNQMIGITSTSGSSVYGIYSTTSTASTSLFINFNTLYINAPSSASAFNSAALYLSSSSTSTSARAYVRNNILVNQSIPGGSGKAVAFRRSGTTLTNFDTTSNNNAFYTTTAPSSSRPVYYDGANSRDSLGSYLAWLATNSFANTDDVSLYTLPSFVSTTPGMIDLHLIPPVSDSVGPYISTDIELDGNNDGIYLNIDIDGDPRRIVSPYLTSIGADGTGLPGYDCGGDPLTISTGCNLIPNPQFDWTNPAPTQTNRHVEAFWKPYVHDWLSVNGGTPDINGTSSNIPPSLPSGLININTAGLAIHDGSASWGQKYYEGICARITPVKNSHRYTFSFFMATNGDIPSHFTPGADFTFKVVLTNCQVFPTRPQFDVGTASPPTMPIHQEIFCKTMNGVTITNWQQYFVTFTADNDYDMIVIYPEHPHYSFYGFTYIHLAMPELVDVTNLVSVTQNSACSYTLEAQQCAVTNATYSWTDGDGNVIGTTNPITINAAINPTLYKLNMSVAGALTNPGNTCSDNFLSVIALGSEATWVGGSGSTLATQKDWNTAANWNPPVVPNDALTDVRIPVTTYPPFISGTASTTTFQINSIVLETGASLINNGLLQIGRNLTGDAQSIDNHFFDPSTNASSGVVTGSIELNGTCKAQNIAGNVFYGNDVKDFKVSNEYHVTISDFATTTGEGLDVHGELSFGTNNTTLFTGDNLTLVSTEAYTANVAQLHSTNEIDGDVTVERYIHTGTASASGSIPAQHAKTWQLLATPTGSSTTGQTIYQSWQESGVVPTSGNGLGTWLVGQTGVGTGFDTYASTASIKYWDPAIGTAGDWIYVNNTSQKLFDKRGYILFVRGDRFAQTFFSAASPTILRSKGPLYQPSNPPLTSTVVTGTAPTSIGNPYASAIDMSYMFTHSGYMTNISNGFTVWDVSIPGTLGLGGYQYIDAGSGYTPTPGGTGNYYESTGSYPEIQSGQAFMVTSNGSTGLVTFDESVKSSNSSLVTRPAGNNQQVVFKANLYSGTGICDGNKVVFGSEYTNNIDANDAIKLQNPGENFMVMKSSSVRLAIEKKQPVSSSDTIFYNFSNLRQIPYRLQFVPTNLQKEGLHAILIDNYLRKEIDISLINETSVEFTVDKNIASSNNRFMVVFVRDGIIPDRHIDQPITYNDPISFIVYPNPINNKTINIFSQNITKGNYDLQLINHAGQVVYKRKIEIEGENSTLSIKPGNIASGIYEVVITALGGKKSIQQIIIN